MADSPQHTTTQPTSAPKPASVRVTCFPSTLVRQLPTPTARIVGRAFLRQRLPVLGAPVVVVWFPVLLPNGVTGYVCGADVE